MISSKLFLVFDPIKPVQSKFRTLPPLYPRTSLHRCLDSPVLLPFDIPGEFILYNYHFQTKTYLSTNHYNTIYPLCNLATLLLVDGGALFFINRITFLLIHSCTFLLRYRSALLLRRWRTLLFIRSLAVLK